MKILKELPGSFASKVFLVELNKQKYVLKRCKNTSEIASEKEFSKVLSQNNIPSLSYLEHHDLKANEMLLEYVEDSISLGNRFTTENCEIWGEVTRKMHNIKYNQCFKLDSNNQRKIVKWSDYIDNKTKEAIFYAKENGNYGFNEAELNQIIEYILPLQDLKFKKFSLIHGDLHTNNVLIRNKELVLFDKNSEVFTGDPLLDLAIAIVDMPNGTLIEIDNKDNANDKNCLESFIKGYKNNFLNDPNLYRYIMLITFGRLYAPFSKYYKEIILNLLKDPSTSCIKVL